MPTSRQMATMTFGDPGLFDFLGGVVKTIAPAVSFGAQFIPGVGPIISKAIDIGASLISPTGEEDERLDDDSMESEDVYDEEA